MAEEKIKLSELYKISKGKQSDVPEKPIGLSDDIKNILLSIAKSISSVKDNIAKLVKIQTKPTKSELFFQKSAEKEMLYEEKFKKKETTPTKIEDKTKIKGEEPGFFDFITNIFSFLLKGGILGTLIAGIGKLLEDPEIRKTLKNFVVDAFVTLFNGIKTITSFIGEILQDPQVITAIVDTVKTIFTVIKDTLLKILNHEVETEYGKFSVGSILLGLVGALAAFRAAIALAGSVLSGLGKIGGGPTPPTVPTGGPAGKPTTPVPQTEPTGKPTTSPGKTTPPTAEPKEKPGFLKTTEDKIKERAEKQAAEKGTKEAGKGILKRFFAGALRFGALAGPWGTAYSLYEIAEYLAPDEQQQLADSIAVLASAQQDIDEIEAGPGTKEEKQKRIDVLKSRSKVELYEDRLKKLLPPVQALPSAPDESVSERKRLGLKTPIPTKEVEPSIPKEITMTGGGRSTQEGPTVTELSEYQEKQSKTPISLRETTPVQDSLLSMISQGESIGGNYNSMNQGTSPDKKIIGSGISDNIIGQKITDMTVGEILNSAPNQSDDAKTRKEKKAIFAAGRYQIIPETLKSLVDKKVVSLNEKFTPEVQDRLALKLIEQTGAMKSIEEGDLEEAQYQLAKVWASLPVPTGMKLQSGKVSTGFESYYGGITANKAKKGLTLASPQLEKMKTTPGVPGTVTVAAAPTQVPGTPGVPIVETTSIPKVETAKETKPELGQILASITKDVDIEKEIMKMIQPVVNNVTNNNVNNQAPSSGGGTNLATASVYDDLFAGLVQRALS